MTDLRSTVQVALQDAGYETWLASLGQQVIVCFEDGATMGFVTVFQEPQMLLDRWAQAEVEFLRHFAAGIRAAGDKAWNVYSVFLSPGVADDVQRRQVRWIEEDLERTRKIASCGLVGRDDVILALLPLLPLQYRPVLEDQDLTERLRKRIASIAPSAVSVALDDSVKPADVLPLLGPSR